MHNKIIWLVISYIIKTPLRKIRHHPPIKGNFFIWDSVMSSFIQKYNLFNILKLEVAVSLLRP